MLSALHEAAPSVSAPPSRAHCIKDLRAALQAVQGVVEDMTQDCWERIQLAKCLQGDLVALISACDAVCEGLLARS